MPVETVRAFCLKLPGAAEDVKWGADLCFVVGGRMFAVVNLEPPHQISFKATAEDFAELVEREGVRPAPYLARAMWVQEETLGEAFGRRELEALLKRSYDLIAAKLPQSRRPTPAGHSPARTPRKRVPRSRPSTRRRRR